MSRIDTFDIKGRIGFCITQCLRFCQHIGKVAAFFTHFGENKVTGAVDDAGQPFDTVTCQALTHSLDDGDATSHRGFKGDCHAFFLRQFKQLITMHRNQGLIRRDHMLAAFNSLYHQVFSNAGTADEFNHDLNVGIINHLKGIIRQVDI